MEIEIGDVVVLVSGSDPMTVVDAWNDEEGGEVVGYCELAFATSDGLEYAVVPADCLNVVDVVYE
jgi:hypothetical protein